MGVKDMLAGLARPKNAASVRERAGRKFAKGDNAAGVATLMELGDGAEPNDHFQIGECYETATGVVLNFATAAKWYERAAEKGHIRAQAKLGDFYLFGRRGHLDKRDNETGASRLLPQGISAPQDFARAYQWNSAAAQAGSAEAQGRLAYQYAMGLGVEPDYALAEHWFLAAAGQGHPSGQFGLGMLYASENLGGADYAKAAHWFARAVTENDDIGSKYYLGLLLKDGLGVPADQERAVELLSEAAEGNHTEAMFRLGELYSERAGDKNFALAETWLRRAGARGHVRALVSLARILVLGTAIPDYSTAAVALREAADLGDALAQFYLGQFYNSGLGVPPDPEEAGIWFSKAADQGVIGAIESLGVMHVTGVGRERDYRAAFSLLSLAAEKGSSSAEFNIGNLYNSGLGVERDFSAAIASFTRAAEGGSPEACLRLGVLYATGEGVEQDYAAAAEWYAKAESHGNTDGTSNLAFLYIRGLGVQLDQARGIQMLVGLADGGNLAAA